MQARQVFSGWNYSMILTKTGQLLSFGWGMYAQLGHGELANEFIPRPITFHSDGDEEEEDIVDCACGLWHTVAVTESGKVYTWGYGKDGQMGDGSNKGSSVPKLVSALRDVACVKKVCCGTRHTVVLTGFPPSLLLRRSSSVC